MMGLVQGSNLLNPHSSVYTRVADLLAVFNAAHKRLSPKPRKLRAYLTSVIVRYPSDINTCTRSLTNKSCARTPVLPPRL